MESAAIGYEVLRRFADPKRPDASWKYGPMPGSWNQYRKSYLAPFWQYIDEQIEDGNLVLAELVRYKHLVECFAGINCGSAR